MVSGHKLYMVYGMALIMMPCNSIEYVYNFSVPAQVSDVSVDAVTSTSVTVTWMPPDPDTHSVVISYTVEYETNCTTSRGVTLANSTFVHIDAERRVVLDDLEEGLNYTVTVSAVNVLGDSNGTEVTLETDPACECIVSKSCYNMSI